MPILIHMHTANHAVDKWAEIQVIETTEKEHCNRPEAERNRHTGQTVIPEQKREKRVEKGRSNAPDRETRE